VSVEPAIEYDQGSGIDGYFTRGVTMWKVKGEYHRIGGPAFVWPEGDSWWYKNGELHRLDGPAVERSNGDKSWYIDDEELTEEEFQNDPRVLQAQAV